MKITLITSCTNRKRIPVDPELQLRNVENDTLEVRFQSWKNKLENRDGLTYKVGEMYSGEHWYIARGMKKTYGESDIDFDLYVCSAGYGLITSDTDIKPYSATFSGGVEDSISNGRNRTDDNQKWWKLLNSWQYNDGTNPRSIARLTEQNPNRTYVIALSNIYLKSIYHDLLEAKGLLNNSENMVVVSTGTSKLGDLTENLLSIDARLERKFKCARTSLNMHTAKHLIDNAPKVGIGLEPSRRFIHSLWVNLKPPKIYTRVSKTDDEIKTIINDLIDKELAVKPSPLLRVLRDGGIACEQKRFSKLFYEVLNGKET